MRRPFLVTLIGVLGVLGGVFSVIAGVVIAVKYDDRQFLADAEVSYADRNQLLAAGLAMIAVGVITVLVSVALLGGSRLARALFTFVELVHIAGAVWVLVEYSHTVSRFRASPRSSSASSCSTSCGARARPSSSSPEVGQTYCSRRSQRKAIQPGRIGSQNVISLKKNTVGTATSLLTPAAMRPAISAASSAPSPPGVGAAVATAEATR